jgi:hypothetical protein
MSNQDDIAKLRALCNRLMANTGDLSQSELTEALTLIAGPRSATKVVAATHKRIFGAPAPRRRPKKGIGSY